jgi:hypothetical protein
VSSSVLNLQLELIMLAHDQVAAGIVVESRASGRRDECVGRAVTDERHFGIGHGRTNGIGRAERHGECEVDVGYRLAGVEERSHDHQLIGGR